MLLLDLMQNELERDRERDRERERDGENEGSMRDDDHHANIPHQQTKVTSTSATTVKMGTSVSSANNRE
jgi:hypothetical protein